MVTKTKTPAVKKPKVVKIPCPFCTDQKLRYPMALRVHQVQSHGDKVFIGEPPKESSAALADVTLRLASSEAKVRELEAAKPAAEPTDKVALLNDWINGLTKEAWQMIGENREFVAVPLSDAVPASDPPPEPSTDPQRVRRIYMANHGIMVTIRPKGETAAVENKIHPDKDGNKIHP